MAVVEIKLTSAGESVTHGTMNRWLFPDGAFVTNGQTLCELDTDKASKEEYASVDGVLKIIVKPGEKIPIGTTLGTIDPSGKPTATAAPVAAVAVGDASKRTPAPTVAVPPTPATTTPLSPAASVMAATKGIDVSKVTPADPRVITKSDLIAHAEAKPVVAAPSVTAPVATPVPAKPVGGIRREKMSVIRQRIAERLLSAQQNAAILTTFNEADMTRVMELRAKYKDSFQKRHGVGLGFMSFFVKASVAALQAYPAVNAFIEGEEIVYHDYQHIGVAVSSEKGLMVPVLRNCELLSFADIEKNIVALASKARENKISLSDLQGGRLHGLRF
ncbi:MAG: dihydrolipoamide succinyltransferase [Planctomycetia bacterium]|nr:dihydrolipoamide succinyltransferase [Planctomycetia bacterium]